MTIHLKYTDRHRKFMKIDGSEYTLHELQRLMGELLLECYKAECLAPGVYSFQGKRGSEHFQYKLKARG